MLFVAHVCRLIVEVAGITQWPELPHPSFLCTINWTHEGEVNLGYGEIV